MPTTTTMFCSVADVQAELNQHAGYTGDNALITAQIKKATALIRSYTRRDWEYGEYVEVFSTYSQDISISVGRNHVIFPLKEKPVDITAPFSVKFNTAGRFDDTDALTSGTDYYFDAIKNQIVMYPSRMEATSRSLQVTYTAGHEIDDEDTALLLVPQNIASACAAQAAFYVQSILNQTSGASQKSDKRGSSVYAITKSGFVSEALNLIKPETRVMVGSNR